MDKCESLVSDSASGSGTTWPPTYAEFIGYCMPPKPKESKPEHKIMKSVFEGLPEPKESKDKRKALGREKCKSLLDMLNE